MFPPSGSWTAKRVSHVTFTFPVACLATQRNMNSLSLLSLCYDCENIFFFVFISHVVCLDGVHIPVVPHYVMRIQMFRSWLSIAGNWKINLSVTLHQSLCRKFHMQIFTWISPPTSLREAVRHLLFCDWSRPLYLFIKRMISSRHPQRWALDISHASFNGQIILAGFW